MREIVTVQVGGFANFLGSHFWNFQDELLGLGVDPHSDPVFRNQYTNMDVLYRSGETQQGTVSYTPRLVSVNLQGSLGSMSSCGTLYNESPTEESDILTWSGNVSTHSAEPHQRNLFLQCLYDEEQENAIIMNGGKNDLPRETDDKDIVECLENVVQYWTDYSKVHYHPRSLYEISGLWIDSQEFDNYGIGRDAFSGGLRAEEISERVRLFVEECDHIQGFQFIVDDSGGFSAVASEILENVADEYGNTPVLLYSVRGPTSHLTTPRSQKQTVSRDLHDAVSFSKLSSFCKLIVPIGLPFLSTSKAAKLLSIDNRKPYHCSAVYGATLHAAALPFMMEQLGPATGDSCNISGSLDVNGLVQILTGQARDNMVGIMDVAMPAPSLTGAQANQTLLGNLHPLTPEVEDDEDDFQAVESITSLGAFTSGVSRASVREVNEAVESDYRQAKSRPMFRHLSVTRCPLPIPLPFPAIFCNVVGQQGNLLSGVVGGASSSSRGSLDVHSVPVAARLRSSSAVLPFLENRLGKLRRYGIERGAPGAQLLRAWGFAQDELEDMREALSRMVAKLNPDVAMSSDSD